MAPGASPCAGDICQPPGQAGPQSESRTVQGLGWGGRGPDCTPAGSTVGMSHQPGRHLVGATEAIGLRPGVGPGAAPGSHQGLCRRTGILVDLVFVCFARASRGQRGIQTPLCWPLSLVPHKLSLDVGAGRVGGGRRLLQERTLVFGSGVGWARPSPLPSLVGLQARPPRSSAG